MNSAYNFSINEFQMTQEPISIVFIGISDKIVLSSYFFGLLKTDRHGSQSLFPRLIFHLLQQRPLKYLIQKLSALCK